jgi:phage tail sheath protein FI
MAEQIVSPGVFQRETDQSFITPAPVEVGAAIVGPTVKGPVERPTVVTSFADYKNKFGTTFVSASENLEFFTSIAVQKYFANGGNSMLVTRVGSGAFTEADSTFISASEKPGVQPFTLKTLGEGDVFNNSTGVTDGGEQYADSSLVSGSKDNLRWEITGINNKAGTFNVSIRRGDDNLNNKIILETFVGCSLDPKSENYISRIIGDQYTDTITEGGQTFIRTKGEYANRSKFVRVDTVTQTPDYTLLDGSVGVDGAGTSYSASLPITSSGSFHGATGNNIPAASGLLAFNNISATNSQGVVAADYTTALNILKNTDEYRFATLTIPGMYNKDYSGAVAAAIELCEGRGDCFLIADMVAYNKSVSDVTAESGELNTNFAGTYWPWVQVPSVELSRNVWCPASVVMQGVYAANDRVAAPWFAPAGLNRGGVPVVRTEFKLNQSLRDTLYDNKINPIATFPRVGPVAYGQKTLQTKASALDRINVRRLLISLKNFIGDTSKNLVFEQNTTVTRNKFLNAVNPFLESVQQRQGLYAFKVVMDETNNTAEAIDRNQLVGQIFIQPTKTAEFIILDYTIQPTGATFSD